MIHCHQVSFIVFWRIFYVEAEITFTGKITSTWGCCYYLYQWLHFKQYFKKITSVITCRVTRKSLYFENLPFLNHHTMFLRLTYLHIPFLFTKYIIMEHYFNNNQDHPQSDLILTMVTSEVIKLSFKLHSWNLKR